MTATLRFTKMHGLGNDYIYVEGFTQKLDDLDAPAVCRKMSDRHKGIGADGLVVRRWDNVKVDGHAEEVLNAVRDA